MLTTRRITTVMAIAVLAMSCTFNNGGTPADPDDVDAAQPGGDGGPGTDGGNPGIDGGNPGTDGGNPGIDAPMPIDAMGCQGWTYDPEHFDPCTVIQPTANLILNAGDYTYNTDDGSLMGATAPPTEVLALVPEVRLIAINRLEIQSGATLRVIGSRPLLIAAWEQISVSGTIDVSSSLGAPGAGSNPMDCNASAPGAGTQGEAGGGGGGGGGFGGDGGAGGDGNEGDGSGDDGAKGAKGSKVSTPNNIRGGCDGATGAAGDRNNGAGAGGPGGGALYLAANNVITVDGLVNASGAGGEGATGDIGGGGQTRRSGGGGGGSGGYIALEATTVTAESGAFIVANGGGGGGGCNGGDGQDGEDGREDGTQASGGPKEGGDSGAGGNSGFSGQPDANDGDPNGGGNGGGGGGGGGVGHIIVHSMSFDNQGATISPTPQ